MHFPRPPGSSGANMSNSCPWYLTDFVGIGAPPRHGIGCNIVAVTLHAGDCFGDERKVNVDAS